MTSIREIKKEIEMLERVLTPKEKGKGEELNQLLKAYEMVTSALTIAEEHEIVKEVCRDLMEKGLIH